MNSFLHFEGTAGHPFDELLVPDDEDEDERYRA